MTWLERRAELSGGVSALPEGSRDELACARLWNGEIGAAMRQLRTSPALVLIPYSCPTLHIASAAHGVVHVRALRSNCSWRSWPWARWWTPSPRPSFWGTLLCTASVCWV